MMNMTQRMECLSRAYVQAVAAYAGFQISSRMLMTTALTAS